MQFESDTGSTWRQIVDSASDTAIVAIDAAGRVTLWSRGAARLLGWREAEMLGQDLSRLFTDEDRRAGRLQREMEDAASLGRGGGEEGWRLRRDGSRFWAVGELSPVRDAEGRLTGYVKILRDRTEQKRAEDDLAEERRLLALIYRASSAMAREPRLEQVVQVVTETGVELTGARYGAFFHRVQTGDGEHYQPFTCRGAPRDAFEGFPRTRGAGLFAPAAPGVQGSGVLRCDDVAEERQADRLPVRSYLAVPVVSRSGEVLGGLFLGHPEPGRFDERDERGLAAVAAEAAVAIDNARLVDERQREIDERRRAEEALRELNATLESQVLERTQALERQGEALRQSQKLEAIGQLTGGVAHDFNNLLQSIFANLEFMRRSLGSDRERAQRALDGIANSARRAASLTQRLLAFARRQPLEPKPVDVNALVRGMSELLRRTLGETIEIATDLAPDAWGIEVDPTELESAILNLAVNARDAMPTGGRLTISTRNLASGDARRSADAPAGDHVELSVRDTGAGMPPEVLQHAFEPFFTTKPVGIGTGLGLSQVYGFVKQSGGHAAIASTVGSGTTLTMLLPRHEGPASAPTAAAPGQDAHDAHEAHVSHEAHEAHDRGAADGTGDAGAAAAADPLVGATILVVEDDPDVRVTTLETLREAGCHVLEAATGAEAIAQLEARRAPPDLIVTDVVLSGDMTGAQVAARARERLPGVPVLFVSGYERNALMHGGRLDAGVHLLSKPFTAAALAREARVALRGR